MRKRRPVMTVPLIGTTRRLLNFLSPVSGAGKPDCDGGFPTENQIPADVSDGIRCRPSLTSFRLIRCNPLCGKADQGSQFALRHDLGRSRSYSRRDVSSRRGNSSMFKSLRRSRWVFALGCRYGGQPRSRPLFKHSAGKPRNGSIMPLRVGDLSLP